MGGTSKGKAIPILFDSLRLSSKSKRRKVVIEEEEHKTCKFRLNEVTMKEEKNNLHWCHSQYMLHSHSLMKLFSSLSYINKNKNYIERKIKDYTKLEQRPDLKSITAQSSLFSSELAAIYSKN